MPTTRHSIFYSPDALPDAKPTVSQPDPFFTHNQTPDTGLLTLALQCWYQFGSLETHTTTILRPFFWEHPGEPVPEENFWTLWHKGRLTEADTLTIRLGATPAGLTSAHLHHSPIFPPNFFTGRMPFLPPNQQRQSTEGKKATSAFRLGRRR